MNLDALLKAFPGLKIEDKSGALLVPREMAVRVAQFLKEDTAWAFDMATNVTGVDYPGRDPLGEAVEGSGFLETVYHLYSIQRKAGPLVLKVRTRDRVDCRVPSLTPVWRSCEFQEREAFDLFGIFYEGHPDLRRLLMWDEFQDHPMRKDYVAPDDFEYEPTAHDEVLERAKSQGAS